jgi:hypothetical protein
MRQAEGCVLAFPSAFLCFCFCSYVCACACEFKRMSADAGGRRRRRSPVRVPMVSSTLDENWGSRHDRVRDALPQGEQPISRRACAHTIHTAKKLTCRQLSCLRVGRPPRGVGNPKPHTLNPTPRNTYRSSMDKVWAGYFQKPKP